jgi:hypothetical protein
MNAARAKLTLPKLRRPDDAAEDRPFELGIYDFLLPCRHFVVSHKVAELAGVSMTAEFLLRLLNSVEGMNERDIGSFFGFDERETGYVIREAEEAGHVTRKEGRLWLTIMGRGLFRDGSEEPQIYEVEKRTTTVGFDLLAIAPAQREIAEPFRSRAAGTEGGGCRKGLRSGQVGPGRLPQILWGNPRPLRR